MPFLYDIPKATDQLSISQGDILNNFGILGVIAGNATPNTASLNSVVGFNFNNFALQVAAPSTAANQMALYTYTNANTTNQELYIQRQSTAAGVPAAPDAIPMTAFRRTTGAIGWTYLPSGCLMLWGTVSIPPGAAGVPKQVLFSQATGFPGFLTTLSAPSLTVVSASPTIPNAMPYVASINRVGGFFFIAFNAATTLTFTVQWSIVGN